MVAALVQGLRGFAVTVIPRNKMHFERATWDRTYFNKCMVTTCSVTTCCELGGSGLGTGPAMSFNITAQYFLDDVEAFQWAMCIGYTAKV